MLLTITYEQTPATDLGYLLHKNPSRLHTIELNFGKAYVFFPEVGADLYNLRSSAAGRSTCA